jgi:hypothetical protein
VRGLAGRGAVRRALPPPHRLEAEVSRGQDGVYYIVDSGRVRCGSCGNDAFRAVLDHEYRIHLFCTRCGCEHRSIVEWLPDEPEWDD